MIALDTNLLVRLMVEDDEAQARKARKVVEEASEQGEPILATGIDDPRFTWLKAR